MALTELRARRRARWNRPTGLSRCASLRGTNVPERRSALQDVPRFYSISAGNCTTANIHLRVGSVGKANLNKSLLRYNLRLLPRNVTLRPCHAFLVLARTRVMRPTHRNQVCIAVESRQVRLKMRLKVCFLAVRHMPHCRDDEIDIHSWRKIGLDLHSAR